MSTKVPDNNIPPPAALSANGKMNVKTNSVGRKISLHLALTKPRLAFLSTLTGVAGYLAAPADFSWPLFFGVGLAIFLSACGALALNQYLERNIDAKMERTRERPLPAQQLNPLPSALFGAGLTALGLLLAVFTLPWLAVVLIAITVISYLFLYTPLKPLTLWSTHIGAIPGALPPLIGWTAATGEIGGLGLWLFAIVLLWQMPHFFAIAWMCREDYRRGNIRVLTTTHPDGKRLIFENYLYLALLFPVALGPVFAGSANWIYGSCALVLNTWFLWEGYRFSFTVRNGGRTGNRLFLFSLFYLPALFSVLLFNLKA